MDLAGIEQWVQRLAMSWAVRGLNHRGDEIFRTRLGRPWGPPILLYNGYRVCFPGVTRPGRGVNHPPPSSTEVKERVQLYRYSFSGPSWSVLGQTLTLPDESGTGYGPLMGCCAQDSEQLFYITYRGLFAHTEACQRGVYCQTTSGAGRHFRFKIAPYVAASSVYPS